MMYHTVSRAGTLLVAASLIGAGGSAQAQAGTGTADYSAQIAEARTQLEKYKDPVVAVHDGFFSTLACIEVGRDGGDGELPYKAGGMGVHFFNPANIGPTVDPAKPQVLIYEPKNGKLELVAAEWFVPIAAGITERPVLWGQPFDGPMPGHHPIMPEGLSHYDLHVWLWRDNPKGMFHATNAAVSCAGDPYRFVEDPPKAIGHGTH
jgi:hypothetical protein